MLGLAGDPVEWRDGDVLSDVPFDQTSGHGESTEPPYPSLEPRLLRGLQPQSHEVAPDAHPFPVPPVCRYTQPVFTISACAPLLMDDSLTAGGAIETRTFDGPRELTQLREKTVVNATGDVARAPPGDDSLVRCVARPRGWCRNLEWPTAWCGAAITSTPRRVATACWCSCRRTVMSEKPT